MFTWPQLELPFLPYGAAMAARRELLRIFNADIAAARAAHGRGERPPGQLGVMVAARGEGGELAEGCGGGGRRQGRPDPGPRCIGRASRLLPHARRAGRRPGPTPAGPLPARPPHPFFTQPSPLPRTPRIAPPPGPGAARPVQADGRRDC